MAYLSFKGGIHPPENKYLSEGKEIVNAGIPEEIIIPLSQHIGAPCDPLVEKGDQVLAGQMIGKSEAFVSAPVHASVSGKVKAIEPRLTFTGNKVNSIVIEPDQEQKSVEFEGLSELSAENIRQRIRESGLVGMGGAAFPTSIKLTPPKDKKIDSVIINGCECEPYLTCDHRNILEMPEKIIAGLKIIMKTVEAEKGYIGIETNKMDAIEAIKGLIVDEDLIELVILKTKYPQGAEKQLINAILMREVPSGCLPAEVGALVQNVGTTIKIAEAVNDGKPLIERVLTVSGKGVTEPLNLLVKIGTPISHLIEKSGGFTGDVQKVIIGGPMTGFAQFDMGVPIQKGTSGVLALNGSEVKLALDQPCVRCGRCVNHCPMKLTPLYFCFFAEKDMIDESEENNVLDCFECGACAYVCPSSRRIIQSIRYLKGKVLAKKKGV